MKFILSRGHSYLHQRQPHHFRYRRLCNLVQVFVVLISIFEFVTLNISIEFLVSLPLRISLRRGVSKAVKTGFRGVCDLIDKRNNVRAVKTSLRNKRNINQAFEAHQPQDLKENFCLTSNLSSESDLANCLNRS